MLFSDSIRGSLYVGLYVSKLWLMKSNDMIVTTVCFYFLNAHRHTQLNILEIPYPGNHHHVVFWFHSCFPLRWLRLCFKMVVAGIQLHGCDNLCFLFIFNAHRHTQLNLFGIPCPGNHHHVVCFDSMCGSMYFGLFVWELWLMKSTYKIVTTFFFLCSMLTDTLN